MIPTHRGGLCPPRPIFSERSMDMTPETYRDLIRRLDEIHERMFVEMGLLEISDPRVYLVYDLGDVMSKLRNYTPPEEEG